MKSICDNCGESVPDGHYAGPCGFPTIPRECSDCGHLEPDGRCPTCRPEPLTISGLGGAVTRPNVPIPSVRDMLAALKAISYYQCVASTPGQIDLVDRLRTSLEVGIEQARQEIVAKRQEIVAKRRDDDCPCSDGPDAEDAAS